MKSKFGYLFATAIVIVSFTSCKRGEGEGGGATIKGKVVAKNVQSLDDKYGSVPEANATVYVGFGEDRLVADKSVKTGPDGSFEIPYLRKGTYKLFIYSLDPKYANPNTNVANSPVQTTVEHLVEVTSNKGDVDAGEIVINRDADDGGSATIKGRVFARYHNNSYTTVLGSGYHPDEDVYINFGENVNYGSKVKTAPDGSFIFNYLRKGKYSVYVYSSDSLPNKDHKSPVMKTIEITDATSVNDLGTFIIGK